MAGSIGLLMAIGLVLTLPLAAQQEYDIVIRGGRIVDGGGNPWFRADVGVRGERIARIGDLSKAQAVRSIDAAGLIVSPGFIDPHTHAIRGIFDVPTADNALLQGVTTLVEGNDGASPFPIRASLEKIAALTISPNWASFVGQGTVREIVIGLANRDARPEEIARMKALIAQGMEEGALGISTGLFYVPGIFTKTEEVIELSKVAARYGGIYISHIRNEAEGVLDSVRETIRIGEQANLPVQITHHKVAGRLAWGKSADTLRLVEEGRARGVDVTLDQYPYTASQTSLNALLPQQYQEGGRQEIVQRLRDPDMRKKIKAGVISNILDNRGGGDPKNVYIGVCEWDRSLEGKNLTEIVTQRGMQPSLENAAEVAIEIIERGSARAIFHAIQEADVERILKHPATTVGSDGGISVFGEGVPHPREYGTFARVLGRYVREKKVLTLEEAVRKMSGATAQRLAIRDRGVLREGLYADIAVFDAAKVADTATFEKPHQYAIGVRCVLVNGKLVVDEGRHTGARPGRILYGPAYKAAKN
jgi:dihydroorotase/N-acyl-D-amino-acid deacylase